MKVSFCVASSSISKEEGNRKLEYIYSMMSKYESIRASSSGD